jgi:hypothetical protein
LGNGGSLREIQTNFTVASQGSTLNDTITASPTSSDSGVVVVYGINSQGNDHRGALNVTLPDAAGYLSEGVKTLTLITDFRVDAGSPTDDVNIGATDSGGNSVYGNTGNTNYRGSIIQCVPYVRGTDHVWAVK